LPEELSLRGIVLLNEQPVGGGGFSNVYHGQYQTHDGVRVHVALKLLKISEDQTPDARRTFVKEVLVWHQLRHPNIVPFLGVDSTTFTAPARAMVSLWMSMGNVREYITEYSPASIHAINLLDDVAQGLKYLHSVDVVHGDLCGRNILIDADGHACLSDFGLALFTDPESSRKSLTRAGSRRWMSPELLLAPKNDFKRTRESDVWAFGCVCCEIWTEGVHPFKDLGDGTILLAVSELSQQSPYPTRPTDSAENIMPVRLWQIVQSCFQSEPSERPTGEDLAELFAKKKAQDLQQTASGSAGPSSLPHHDHTVYSPPRTSIPPFRKGKARQKDTFSVVRFGPIDADPAQTFPTIFEGLASRVKTGVLSEPTLVEYGGLDHLLLHFPTLLEANKFAMTWMVYRFAPYLDVVANVVDGQ
ncbi:kinase-like domain-containing protein, partial [Mycena rebaudengoi]